MSRDIPTLRKQAVDIPLNVNSLGRYVSRAASRRKVQSQSEGGPTASASYFKWAFSKNGPNLSHGGLHLPNWGDGLRRFYPSRAFSACGQKSWGRRWNIIKLHVSWGHALADQLSRASVDSDRETRHPANYVGEALEGCEVCRALDKAAHIPTAGTSAVPAFDEKLQADLLFLGDATAPRTMDIYSAYSLLVTLRSKNPREVWNFFAAR